MGVASTWKLLSFCSSLFNRMCWICSENNVNFPVRHHSVCKYVFCDRKLCKKAKGQLKFLELFWKTKCFIMFEAVFWVCKWNLFCLWKINSLCFIKSVQEIISLHMEGVRDALLPIINQKTKLANFDYLGSRTPEWVFKGAGIVMCPLAFLLPSSGRYIASTILHLTTRH